MKLTLQIQLLPDAEQSLSLKYTIERFNEAASWLAGEAFALRSANKVALQKKFYRQLREQFGLSSQMAVRCIAQVCEAYKKDKSKRPRFRKHAAIPYDQRLMSFKGVDRVSLLTLTGRVIVPFVMGKYQQERFTNAIGQSDLVLRKDGKWFLLVTVDIPDKTPIQATDFIGVDLGVENIATTSDGERTSGKEVENIRQRHHRTRKSLQKKTSASNKRQTRRNAKRALKRIGNKESRFRKHTNHVISKSIVKLAEGTNRGIALEDIKGIRSRTRFRRDQRAKMSGWAFFQLRTFIEYKATLSGVPVVVVDPRNTSRTCSQCGHCEKANRKSQDEFLCRQCGNVANADENAAINIAVAASVSMLEESENHRLLSLVG